MKQSISSFSYFTVGFLLTACIIFSGCQTQSTAPELQEEHEVSSVNEDTKAQNAGAENKPVQVEAKEQKAKVEPDVQTVKPISSADIPGIASAYSFSAEIPGTWQIEYIPSIEAISIYDPAAAIDSASDSNLEESQIFIRYFSASDFLTLSTVTIHSSTATKIQGRPAVVYDIEKNAGVPNFPDQPAWRNARHTVTDIRSTDENPTVFYVFAKNPDLDQEVFDTFVESVRFE